MRIKWKLLTIDFVNFLLICVLPFWAGYKYWFFKNMCRVCSGFATVMMVVLGFISCAMLFMFSVILVSEFVRRYVE